LATDLFNRLTISVLLAAVLATSAIKLRGLPIGSGEKTDDYSAIILVVVSVAGLFGALLATAIRNKRCKNDKDDE